MDFDLDASAGSGVSRTDVTEAQIAAGDFYGNTGVISDFQTIAPKAFATGLANAASIKATPSGRGLLVLGRDGTVLAYGDAPQLGNATVPHAAVTLAKAFVLDVGMGDLVALGRRVRI